LALTSNLPDSTAHPVAASSAPTRSRVRTAARTLLGLAAGLAVAAVAGWWLGVKPREVLQHILGVPAWVVVFCVLSSYVVLAFQALRWHSVMGPLLGLPYGQAYRAQVVGMMFNAILPARGGDLLRVQYLGRRTGKSRATILGTEAVDRWLDWWGWFPVLFVVALTGPVPRWLYEALGLFALILGSWGTTMVVLSRRGFVPKRGSRFGAAFASFRTGIEAFRSRRMVVLALAIAPLPWLWESFAIRLAAHAFGIELSLAMAFSVLIGFNVAMLVPSPGAVGSVETGGTAALVYFGVDQSAALGFMFVYHFSQLLPGIALGAAILVAEGEKLFGKESAFQPDEDNQPVIVSDAKGPTESRE
jgi:glycosyltransferase 2 family protein